MLSHQNTLRFRAATTTHLLLALIYDRGHSSNSLSPAHPTQPRVPGVFCTGLLAAVATRIRSLTYSPYASSPLVLRMGWDTSTHLTLHRDLKGCRSSP